MLLLLVGVKILSVLKIRALNLSSFLFLFVWLTGTYTNRLHPNIDGQENIKLKIKFAVLFILAKMNW